MTKLEKIKNELSRCQLEIGRLKEKEKKLEEKKQLEEQKEIRKLMGECSERCVNIKELVRM